MAGEIVYGLGGRSTTEHGPAAKLGTQNIKHICGTPLPTPAVDSVDSPEEF